jgi:acyl-CoA reductase-like NAD-dependent aldehyde dehydrogenase
MTPTMTPTKDLTDALRRYNAFRRGEWAEPMTKPQEITRLLDAAADRLEELEEQLAANHEAIKLMGKWLEDERALADRLADALTDSAMWYAPPAYQAWKEARSE